MIATHLEDMYYHLVKDYGTIIQYNQIGKAVVDVDTGERSNAQDRVFQVKAIFTPTETYVEFLHKLLGRTEKNKTDFMVKLSDLPPVINVENDYVKHGNLKYRNLTVERFGGKVGILTGEAV